MNIEVGFTGTRKGMSQLQKTDFAGLIRTIKVINNGKHHLRFNHGDCIGADAEVDGIIRNIGGFEIVIHPPVNSKYQANCFQIGDQQYPRVPYIIRDKRIVDLSWFMFAAPLTDRRARSGTWTTIKMAEAKVKNDPKFHLQVLPRG